MDCVRGWMLKSRRNFRPATRVPYNSEQTRIHTQSVHVCILEQTLLPESIVTMRIPGTTHFQKCVLDIEGRQFHRHFPLCRMWNMSFIV